MSSTTRSTRARLQHLSHWWAGVLSYMPPWAVGSTRSVRRRLMAWLGAMALLTLFVTLLSVGLLVHQAEQGWWIARQMEESTNSAAAVTDFFEGAGAVLRLVGQLSPAQIASPGLLEIALDADPSLLEIVRTDSEGSIIASVDRDRSLLADMFTLTQSQWFQSARSGDTYLSEIQDTYDGRPYVILARPVPDGGVVATRVQMDVLQLIVANLDWGETGRVYLVDDDGRIVAYSNPAYTGDDIRNLPGLGPAFATGTPLWSGEFTSIQGDAVLGTLNEVPGTPWHLVTEVTQVEAYAASRTVLTVMVLEIMVLNLVVMVSNASFLRRLIFEPLDRLRSGTHRVGDGEFGFRLHHPRQDEIGQAMEAFNGMAAALEQRNLEVNAKNVALQAEIDNHKQTQLALQQLNASLEERIAARTHDLEALTANLLRSNSALQEFAYVASHDLQEPLRKVRAFGDRLLARNSAQLDATGQDYLIRMQKGAERMQALIDALLTYSRVTTQAQPFVPVDLNLIAHEVTSDLEMQIERAGGQVKIEHLDVIDADPLQMRQLLQNLISNGIKFRRAKEPPLVVVAGRWLSHVEAEAPRFRSAYQITVADNGIGIETQYTDRIFQVFQRLHGRTEYEGTGVGLAICRKIAERHNGTITVQSTPGQGSVFIVTLAGHPPTMKAAGEPC